MGFDGSGREEGPLRPRRSVRVGVRQHEEGMIGRLVRRVDGLDDRVPVCLNLLLAAGTCDGSVGDAN
eukprot:1285242-Lingulodinium_polyedra.AAC.1